MTLPEVINRNRGRLPSVTGPGGMRINPVTMGGGPPITTPLQPVSPQLPQIPTFMPGVNPGANMGGFNPASYLNPYHPDPHGGFNLYGNNTPGQQPLGTAQANGLKNMQSQLPAQPRTYGA